MSPVSSVALNPAGMTTAMRIAERSRAVSASWRVLSLTVISSRASSRFMRSWAWGSAVEIDYVGGGVEGLLAAERTVHQGEKDDGQRDAECQLTPVAEVAVQLEEGDMKR